MHANSKPRHRGTVKLTASATNVGDNNKIITKCVLECLLRATFKEEPARFYKAFVKYHTCYDAVYVSVGSLKSKFSIFATGTACHRVVPLYFAALARE